MNPSSPVVACAPTADESFGPGVQDCRDDFDFTLSFEHYIFTLIPAALLVIAGPIRLFRLRKAPNAVAGKSLRLAKLTGIAIFAALQLSLTVLWSGLLPASRLRSASIAASSISLASSLVFCALSHAEHAKSVRPSSILNAYLLLSALLDGATLRTVWLSLSLHPAIKGVFSASFALKITLLVLEAKEKERWVGAGRVNSPEETAGLYGQAMLWWITPLMKTGFKRLLKPLDLLALDRDMTAAVLADRFQRHWTRSKPGPYRLVLVCVRTLGWSLLSVVVPRLCLLVFTICQPLVLNRFLVFLSDESQSDNVGYGLIGAYGLVYFGIAVSSSLYWHRACRSLAMLRGALVAGIYEHTTKLSVASVDNSAAVTLMSTDVDTITRAVKQVHEFWANIVQIAVATWLLSSQIGFAASGPIMVAALSLLATIYVSPAAKKYQVAWVQKVQKRISVTSSMLGHMKSIKMSGLGPRLNSTIASLRQDEMDSAMPFRLVATATSSIAQIPLMISPVVAFAMFTAVAAQTGETLDSTRLFAALSLIILLASPLFWMFEVVLDMSAALGCFKRIEAFLEKPGRMEYREVGSVRGGSSVSVVDAGGGIEMRTVKNAGRNSSDERICLQDASLAWVEDRKVLSGVNFSVEKGQFVMVVGPVASGKTTLLKGILGEILHATGRVRLADERISWCDQTPWIINGTIKQNITAFADFDQPRYDSVLKACDLEKDIAQLPDGDQSIVGSKGVALSGGQKQRVALARAVYSLPQIALFDDVFSGLDNHTANTIFRRLFSSEGMLRRNGATIVLATQSVKFLPVADTIIALGDGKVVEMGSFGELVGKGGYVASLITSQPGADAESGKETSRDLVDEVVTKKTPKPKLPEVDDMKRQMGDVTIYKYYFGNIGGVFVVGLVAMEVVYAFFTAFPTVWLKFWTDANAEAPNQRVGFYLGIYGALQVGGLLSFGALIWFVLIIIAARSGINLHQRLLTTVVKAPLSLYTGTDTGSITTRFSQDIGLLDRNLPLALVMTLAGFFTCIGKAVLVASASWYIALSFPALILLFFYLQRAYLRTSRQLRLLDLEEKAPVYAQFLETLSGLSTLRAHAHTPHSTTHTHALIDRSQRPFYLLLIVQQWLALVLDLTVTGLALLIVGLAVRLRQSVSVGLAGVSLVQLVSLAEAVKLLIQFWTSLETSLGAVARIKAFAEETGSEDDGDDEGQGGVVPDGWPNRGEVEIRNLVASYDGVVNALDGISLSIPPGQKVGICGRTGSGKSTLLLTLLRLLDPTTTGSSSSYSPITIDTIPTTTIPHETLRQRIAALSQEGFVLPGTVRQNADPFASHTDAEIADALQSVGLWDVVQQRGGLDAEFEKGALSHGQRQLFFVGRAVLRAGVGRVVLMDEATSGIDHHTEATIRDVIRSKFHDHTVISIAHRLDTIVDFDVVVVLEKGRIVEVGPPKELLGKRGGKFHELWDASHGGAVSA